jgi:DNA-binding NtrC family response regulator
MSEFQVKLPVLPVAPTIQSKRVLVMDDEESICKMVCRMLRKLGYEADQAQDGVRALEMYRNALSTEKPFGAVIMDLTIPNGMGGKQAIKDLLDIDPAAKAIVSSGYSNDPIMSDHKSYGFCAVMQKPYSSKDLESVLNQVLSGPND